jgi:hypothetical protein
MSSNPRPVARRLLFEPVAVEHVPERPRGPRLVVADAGIDQDVVVRRLDDEALYAQDQAAVRRIEKGRLEPRPVLVEQLLGEARKELQRVEPRALLLDYRVDGDVLKCDGGRHGRSSVGSAEQRC